MKTLLMLCLTLLASSGAWGQEAKEVQTLVACANTPEDLTGILNQDRVETSTQFRGSERVFVRAPFQAKSLVARANGELCVLLQAEQAAPAPLSGMPVTTGGSGFFVSCTARLGGGSWQGIGFTDGQAKVAAIDACMQDTGSSKEACEAAEFTCK